MKITTAKYGTMWPNGVLVIRDAMFVSIHPDVSVKNIVENFTSDSGLLFDCGYVTEEPAKFIFPCGRVELVPDKEIEPKPALKMGWADVTKECEVKLNFILAEKHQYLFELFHGKNYLAMFSFRGTESSVSPRNNEGGNNNNANYRITDKGATGRGVQWFCVEHWQELV